MIFLLSHSKGYKPSPIHPLKSLSASFPLLFLLSILSVHTIPGRLPISGTTSGIQVKLPQWYLMLKDYNRLSVLSSSADGDLWMGMERRIMIIFTITIARRRCIKCLTLSSSFSPGISCQGKVAPSHPALEWSDKCVRKLVPGAVFCLVNSFHWYIKVCFLFLSLHKGAWETALSLLNVSFIVGLSWIQTYFLKN